MGCFWTGARDADGTLPERWLIAQWPDGEAGTGEVLAVHGYHDAVTATIRPNKALLGVTEARAVL